MAILDNLGLPLTGASTTGVDHYLRAVHELQCFIGDPVGSIDAAIAADPGFVMAHVFKGYLYGLSTDREAMAVARQCHETCKPPVRRPSAKVHMSPPSAQLAGGGWHEAGRILEDVTIDHPRDGCRSAGGPPARLLPRRCAYAARPHARALPAWDAGMPGYHAMLGMQAFGLEETGDYATVKSGRASGRTRARDGWAQHAVAHVMEMQCRQRDGIAWMMANPENWSKKNFLQIHNWWRVALYHLDLGEVDEVLGLFDGPVCGAGSTLALNLVDASAILWRLHLGGVDVGDRWQAGRQLGAEGNSGQLRVQRHSRHDGVRWRRPCRFGGHSARCAAPMQSGRRGQCRVHP